MPSRRAMLSGTVATVTSVLAGCSGGEASPPVRPGDAPRPPGDSTVVARDTAFHEAPPHGAVQQSSAAHEYTDSTGTTRLFVCTRHRLVPGRSEASEGWRLAGFTVDHDYAATAPTGATNTDASFVPVDDGDGSTGVRMSLLAKPDSPDLVDRWRVRYRPPSPATWGPAFLTEVVPGVTFRAGDRVATTRLRTRVERWPLQSATLSVSTDLRYGRGRDT